MQIVSCVEQRATPPLSSQVVCRQSALLNLPSERIIMMDDCDHRTMCQFRNAQDRNYRLIRSEVEELLGLTANHMRVEAISDCLRYLQFAEMSNRHHDIDPAAINTCAWLLEHPKFEDWRDQKQRLLWIRGKPGAGKSTLMKYALETSIEESTAPNARMIILSFFFHGRGNNLQKSSEGFYRSMLHQILSRAPFSVDSMLRDFDQHVSNRGRPGQAWNWHIREYQKHLITALEILSEKFKFSVRIFVDALDEGGEITAQNMVDEFQHILEKSAQGTKLAICFSCRHYPIIDVEDHATIVIEDENDKDIRTFVTNSFGQDHGMETVRDIIIKKATGSFQWTRLVVELVRRKRRQGSLPQQIRQAIEAIPPDLNKLYRELLETIPQDELPTVVRVFEWMLFARNNLSVNELRIATAIDPNLPHKTLNEYLEKGLLMDNNDDFGRRLTTMSRGLAEIRADVGYRGRRTNQRVQFNHQSVIDFLHQDGLQILLGNQWQNREIAFGRANHTLSRICLHYVSMEHSFSAPPHTPSDSTEYDWATETYQLFATYAVRNWIYHMQKAHSFGISQVDLLECFAWPSNHLMDRWIDLCHLLDENAYYFAPRKSTLLHILSENGLVDALSLALNKRDRCFLQKVVDCKNEYGETPLFWAANADEVDAVKLLLEQGFADPNSQNIEGRTILSCAAVRGADEVVGLLLGCDGMDLESKDCEGRTPLVRASERGRHNVVRMLLERGAKSQIIDNEGRTPLLLASENGHEEVVKLLLAIDGARPNFVDDIGRTPLSWAARNGRDAVVEALLGCGEVQLDIKDKNGRSPLSLAVEFRRDKVINLLLARKIDFDMKDHGGRTPLSWAASSPGDLAGNRAVEALLLAGADVDSRDDSGRTPLSWAAAAPNRHGHNHAVKLLLEHGAEADSKDNSGRTPLSWAAEALPTLSKFTFWYTNWAVDILLSRSDVDARSRDSLGHDPLWWARERSSKRSVARLSGWYQDRLNVNHDEI